MAKTLNVMLNDFLSHFEMFGIKLGLQTMQALLDHFNHPEKELKFIHIAGTNGKGSTSVLLASALQKVGYKVGFYSSPHLVRVNERFRINQKEVTDTQLELILPRLIEAFETLKQRKICPTYFEVTTLLAILLFSYEKCDFVIWETGMGGRFDATNVVTPLCSVITSISLDHQQYLGDTLAKIAYEKAGIIKEKIPCFSISQPTEVMAVLRTSSQTQNAPLTVVSPCVFLEKVVDENGTILGQRMAWQKHILTVGMLGQYQLYNVALAAEILRFLNLKFVFKIENALSAWATLKWRGRFDFLDSNLILDGAHNVAAAQSLCTSFQTLYPNEKAMILFANFADKNSHDIIQALLPIAEGFIFIPIQGAKKRPSLHGDALVQLLESFHCKITCVSVDNIPEALTTLLKYKGVKLVTGSLFLLGDVIKVYQSSAFRLKK